WFPCSNDLGVGPLETKLAQLRSCFQGPSIARARRRRRLPCACFSEIALSARSHGGPTYALAVVLLPGGPKTSFRFELAAAWARLEDATRNVVKRIGSKP